MNPPRIILLEEATAVPLGAKDVHLHVELPVLGETVGLTVLVEDVRARLLDVVPLAYQISDRLNALAARKALQQGQAISCHRGCGHCCNLPMVIVAAPEAMRLVYDLSQLPPGERKRIESGLAAAVARISKAPVPAIPPEYRLPSRVNWVRQLLEAWWVQVRTPCPMVREGACTIYPFRPCLCREVAAITPPENCATGGMKRLPLSVSVRGVLRDWAAALEERAAEDVPIYCILQWVGAHTVRTNRTWRLPQMVQRFLDELLKAATREPVPQEPLPDGRPAPE